MSGEPFPTIAFLEGEADDDRCPDCGFLSCMCFDDERDEFDCHMGPDGFCRAAGSEMCDFECPTMRAYRDGSLP